MARYGRPSQDIVGSSAERLLPRPVAAASAAFATDGDHARASSPPPPQHGRAVAGRCREVGPRQNLSQLLSSNLVASGTFATGKTFDPKKGVKEMPHACMPRIKLRAMTGSLALPLSKRQAEKLKAAQISAGQERDVNADGVPETRLPWAVRPDIDFKIVNHKAWSAGVVAPVVRQVCMPGVAVLLGRWCH